HRIDRRAAALRVAGGDPVPDESKVQVGIEKPIEVIDWDELVERKRGVGSKDAGLGTEHGDANLHKQIIKRPHYGKLSRPFSTACRNSVCAGWKDARSIGGASHVARSDNISRGSLSGAG